MYQSKSFARTVRKFNQREKVQLDNEIKKGAENPSSTGSEKRGDLKGLYVHTLYLQNHLYLLAYRYINKETLELFMIGPHVERQ